MEPLERFVFRNHLELSAQRVGLEMSGVVDYSYIFSFCRLATLGFVERLGSVASDSLEAILYFDTEGADGKLTCVSIQEEWLFHW